jgi:NitT/TauT family transport system substrate-binding protein
VKVVNLGPQAAANAMIAGTDGIDAAMTYEPYLGAVRAKPEAGKIIATTLDYPMVMDTFGCTPKFLAENPKAAKAWPTLLRRAGDDQGRPQEALPSWAPTSSKAPSSLRASQKYLRWQDRAANQKFFAGEHAPSARKPPTCCWRAGIIKRDS